MIREEMEEIVNDIRCATFHCTDEEAKPIIDEYLDRYPQLLEFNTKEWYYKNC